MGTPLAVLTAAFSPGGAALVGPTYRVWVQCSEESVCMFMRRFARETKWKASPRSVPDALRAPLQAPVPGAVTAPAGTLERVWWGHVAGASRAWRGTGSAAPTAPAGLLVSVQCPAVGPGCTKSRRMKLQSQQSPSREAARCGKQQSRPGERNMVWPLLSHLRASEVCGHLQLLIIPSALRPLSQPLSRDEYLPGHSQQRWK